ncbi:MAG: hypothetical protein ACTSYW_10490 [Candidatus Heimdallarchaeota archaeon]
MSVSIIRSKLLEKLNDMQSLKGAWDWETSNPEGKYPFATLTLRDGSGSFESTAHNLRRRGFKIRIYQERSKTGQGPENAEDISASVIDELEEALDMDTTLSGACKYVIPVGWRAGYVDRELDTRILEIDVDAFELVSSD